MKKNLFVLLVAVILTSCTKEKQIEVQQSEKEVVNLSQKQLFEVQKGTGKVLILSEKLSVYDKSGGMISDANGLYGLTFSVDSISTKRIDAAKTDDNCNAFNFIKIKNPKVRGWLYSADVYGYGNSKRDTIFTAGDINFKLYRAKNFGVGVSDDDGLTGCTETTPIVMHNSKYNVESFVPLKDETGKYPGKFLVLDEHDGWYDKIKETSFENGNLKFNIYREYQEGSAYFTILISLSEKGYSAVVTDVIADAEKYMEKNQ